MVLVTELCKTCTSLIRYEGGTQPELAMCRIITGRIVFSVRGRGQDPIAPDRRIHGDFILDCFTAPGYLLREDAPQTGNRMVP